MKIYGAHLSICLYVTLLHMLFLFTHICHIVLAPADTIPKKTKMMLFPNPRVTQILESSSLSNTLRRTANQTKPISCTKHLVSGRICWSVRGVFSAIGFKTLFKFPKKSHVIFFYYQKDLSGLMPCPEASACPVPKLETWTHLILTVLKKWKELCFFSCTENQLPLLPCLPAKNSLHLCKPFFSHTFSRVRTTIWHSKRSVTPSKNLETISYIWHNPRKGFSYQFWPHAMSSLPAVFKFLDIVR